MADQEQSVRSRRRSEDKFRCTLRFEERAAAREFIRKGGHDIVETELLDDGGVQLTILLTQSEIKQLEKEGYSLQVFENASEIGRQRQKEVGSGDRFKGGKEKPRGIGRKIQGVR